MNFSYLFTLLSKALAASKVMYLRAYSNIHQNNYDFSSWLYPITSNIQRVVCATIAISDLRFLSDNRPFCRTLRQALIRVIQLMPLAGNSHSRAVRCGAVRCKEPARPANDLASCPAIPCYLKRCLRPIRRAEIKATIISWTYVISVFTFWSKMLITSAVLQAVLAARISAFTSNRERIPSCFVQCAHLNFIP